MNVLCPALIILAVIGIDVGYFCAKKGSILKSILHPLSIIFTALIVAFSIVLLLFNTDSSKHADKDRYTAELLGILYRIEYMSDDPTLEEDIRYWNKRILNNEKLKDNLWFGVFYIKALGEMPLLDESYLKYDEKGEIR